MKHTIEITIDHDGNPVPLTGSERCAAEQNDQIRWKSSYGQVDVEFAEATPFADELRHGNGEFRVISAAHGTFKYRCTVTTADGKKHGWPMTPIGGGTVVVGSSSRSDP